MAAILPRIAVAGHVCLDMIPSFPYGDGKFSFPQPGRLHEVGEAVFATGGAVSNTGLALHKLGLKTRLIAKVGEDAFGNIILEQLRQLDPELASHLIKSREVHTSYSVVINVPGFDRSFLHNSGANDSFTAADLTREHLDHIDLFHFGYPPVMKQMYRNEGEGLLQLFQKVKSHGITTSLDMAMPDPQSEAAEVDWRKVLSKVLPYVDLFMPSLEEMMMMFFQDKQLSMNANNRDFWDSVSIEDIQRLAADLVEMGCRAVVLKMGELGIYMQTSSHTGFSTPQWNRRELWTPCYQTQVVGTTGAGDCTIAGFIASFVKGLTPERCLNVAAAVGACSVETADATAGIIHWEDVHKRLETGWDRLPHPLPMDHWTWNENEQVWIGRNDSAYE